MKVSVIIPVYNAGLYLKDCLDSILGQTLEEIEVICVDDGSSDDSLGILKEYQESDSRIRVYQQHNCGAGAARNLGISHAVGEYLIFLDADDFFEKEMLRSTFNHAEAFGADIVLFGGRRYDHKSGNLSEHFGFLNTSLLPKQQCFSGEDVSENLFQVTNPAPWTKLYKTTFVRDNGLLFQSLKNSNDVFFTFSSLAIARRIVALNADFVRYRVNTGTSTQSNKDAAPTCFVEAYYALHDFLVNKDLYERFLLTYCKAAISTSEYILKSVKSDDARDKVLDALSNGKFGEFGVWDIPDKKLNNTSLVSRRDFLRAAMLQYQRVQEQNRKREYGVPYEVKYSYRKTTFPDVSVVIPVFNTSRYVEEAIDSVLSNNAVEVELICVNDGSTDDSLSILLDRGERDQRVVVVDKKNGGLSETRNVGMELARGKYILFLDSDDYLREEALSEVVNAMTKAGCDILFFSAETIFDSGDLEPDFHMFANRYQRRHSYEGVYTGPELFELLWNGGEYYSSACMLAIEREFLNRHRISFHPGILHEDNAFTFSCVLAAKRAVCLSDQFYIRRIRCDSIMTAAVSFANSYGYYTCHADMSRTYFSFEDVLTPGQRSAAKEVIASMIASSCRDYLNMPNADIGSEYGIGSDYRAFCRSVKNNAMAARSAAEKQNRTDREISNLKKSLSAARGSLSKIENSRSYRLAKMLSDPVRIVGRCVLKAKKRLAKAMKR